MAVNRSNTQSGIQRAREIANQGQSPLQQAATNAGRVFTPAPSPAPDSYQVNTLPTSKANDNRAPVTPVTHGGPVGCGVAGSGDWGQAGEMNRAERQKYQFTIPPFGLPKEPPIVYSNIEVMGVNSYGEIIPTLTVGPCPNSKYPVQDKVRETTVPQTGGETPLPEKTESIVASVIDKIIEESNEVVKEVESKKDPVRPPVLDVQDVVRPPIPITPTELVLEAQANCEKEIQTPTISIVNENNVNVDVGGAQATASIGPIQITVPEIVRGCTDPDALNYDPAALLDDGTCKFEPVVEDEPVDPKEPPPPPPIDMPETVTFVDSHGAPLFEVLKEEVTKTEQTEGIGYAILPDGKQVVFGDKPLVADIKLVNDVTRPALEDSDIILSPEDKDIADRKDMRDQLGELASDNKLSSDQDIVIIGDREKRIKPIFRNDQGVIFLNEDDTSKLKVSLRSRAFNFNQYKRTIDTSFNEILGKE